MYLFFYQNVLILSCDPVPVRQEKIVVSFLSSDFRPLINRTCFKFCEKADNARKIDLKNGHVYINVILLQV
jgi:hypothetical protein